ncbi:MAG TPA: gephyrin-like molybdotransferase Glp [Pirellulaceae bacterium]|jgi:molybdopterin molybdotransferase|nr:gephyrin-like molybdotransferase Glp [Pirellulaceae bacterium]
MLSVDEALTAVLQRAQPLPPARVPLAKAVGRRLAEDVRAPEPIPPFDKSLMDGFALSLAALDAVAAAGTLRLPITERIVAGEVPRFPAGERSTSRVMTGAPIPEGTNAVVPVEDVVFGEGDEGPWAEFAAATVRPGKHVLRQGEIVEAGEVVLPAGETIRATHVGLLAELGYVQPLVKPAPRVAILSTGDELVDPSQTPGPGQIRNSNGSLLKALLESAGAETIDLGIARDAEGELREKIARGLEADVLMLSGGVSAGVLDLVPQTLASLGAQEVFHKLKLKPGKPLWFGTRERTLVFGFPGNPVSTLIGFVLFGAPALRGLSGEASPAPRLFGAKLTRPHAQRGDRPTYWPGRLVATDGEPSAAEPLPWKGSADQTAYALADCLIVFPAGDRTWNEGEVVRCLSLGSD